MTASCTIQLHADDAWHDIGVVTLFGTPDEGWRARAYTGYDVEWAVRYQLARDAHAMTCRFSVGLEPLDTPHWPVFLIDLLPQGFGRAELLHRLGLPETAEERADWPLLLAGAANSIGNLRIKEAVDWLAERQGRNRALPTRRSSREATHSANTSPRMASSLRGLGCTG